MKDLSVRRKPHKPLTPASLHEAALAYLSRFAASGSGLRRVLTNRLRSASLLDPPLASDPAALARLTEAVDVIVERLTESGIINDASFAALKATSLRRQGSSSRKIAEKLAQKGIKSPLIYQALLDADEETSTIDNTETENAALAEEAAARIFARKKRLIEKAASPEGYQKALASLARAGFPLSLGRKILGDAPD